MMSFRRARNSPASLGKTGVEPSFRSVADCDRLRSRAGQFIDGFLEGTSSRMSSTKHRLATPCLLVSLDDGEAIRHPIRGREATVGRDPTNDICIPNHLISKFHAKLLIANQSVTVVDLDSVNKTRLNGQIVTHAAVRYGDELHFARVRCRLVLEEPQRAEVAEGLSV
jgi:hypothetical protein